MTWISTKKGKILRSRGQGKRAFCLIFSSLEGKIAAKCQALRWLGKGEVKTASLLFCSHGVSYQKKLKMNLYMNEGKRAYM